MFIVVNLKNREKQSIKKNPSNQYLLNFIT